MIKLYNRLLNSCKTINQMNRFIIALGNKVSSEELYKLKQDIEFQYFGCSPVPFGIQAKKHLTQIELEAYETIKSWIALLETSGKKQPEPFARRKIRKDISLYSSGGSTSEKTLLICFTGDAQRLMMAISIFLQHRSASDCDILLLKDVTRNGFRKGILGVANNFESLVMEIDKMIDRSTYKHVVSYGTSGGGLPAIWTAIELQLDKGVSIAGRGVSQDDKWQDIGRYGGIATTLTKLVAKMDSHPNLLQIYSSDKERDKNSTSSLAAIIPVNRLAVQSRHGKKIGHGVLSPFLQQSRLMPLLDIILDPSIIGYGKVSSEMEKISQILI